jgi:hypothetical protein
MGAGSGSHADQVAKSLVLSDGPWASLWRLARIDTQGVEELKEVEGTS